MQWKQEQIYMGADWQRRVWNIGAVLLAVTLAASGLALVLACAGDEGGQHFAWGIAAVAASGLLADLLVLAVRMTNHAQRAGENRAS